MPRVCPLCHARYEGQVEICHADGTRLIVDLGDPYIDRVIGRYRLLERLGSGAIGAVYRARTTENASEVALKLLTGEAALKHSAIKRFEREAEAISKINHPNVVSVIDFGVDGETMFLAMELLAGQTLEEVVAAEGRVQVERVADIARQVALGLTEAHRLGFIHRDLKPANVMLVTTRNGEVAKILDFGVVRIADPASGITRLTAQGITVGTPAYMAPEQMQDASVGPEADLYALGIMMYEMLSGAPPFTGSLRHVVLQQMGQPPAPLGDFAGLEEIVHRLLEKEPEKRPRTAEQLVRELSEFLKDRDPTKITFNELDPSTDDIATLGGGVRIKETTDKEANPLYVSHHGRPVSDPAEGSGLGPETIRDGGLNALEAPLLPRFDSNDVVSPLGHVVTEPDSMDVRDTSEGAMPIQQLPRELIDLDTSDTAASLAPIPPMPKQDESSRSRLWIGAVIVVVAAVVVVLGLFVIALADKEPVQIQPKTAPSSSSGSASR